MDRSPLPERRSFPRGSLFSANVWGISCRFQQLSPSPGQVSYVLLTRAPLSLQTNPEFPFDLHVLGTPPAFILSQDQTLRKFTFKFVPKLGLGPQKFPRTFLPLFSC